MSFIGPRKALLAGHTRPSWSWDFTRGATPSGAAFTRASPGAYFDQNGVLQTAASGVARFDHDPLTFAPLGYLAEMASTNYVPYSSNGSHWSLNNATQTTDGTPGPDGSTAAVKVTASAGTGTHNATAGVSSAQGAGNPIVMSAFAKQGSTRYVVLAYGGDAPWHLATFDFVAGAWSGTGTNVTLLPPRQLANGWWRIAASYSPTNNVGGIGISPSSTGTGTTTDLSYNAAGTETVYTTGWQVDTTGVGLTSYIPTSGSTATRAQDFLSLPLTSLTGWNPGQGGVLVATYRLYALNPAAPGYNQMAAWISNAGNYTNSLMLNANQGGADVYGVAQYSGGAGAGSYVNGGASPQPFVRRRQSFGWQPNRIVTFRDGVSDGLTNTAASPLPLGPTRLDFGYYSSGGLNGVLESLAYYAGARSDAFVQQVSR